MSYAQSHGHLLTIRRTNAHASAPDVVAAVRACFVARCMLHAPASAPDVVSASRRARRCSVRVSLRWVAPHFLLFMRWRQSASHSGVQKGSASGRPRQSPLGAHSVQLARQHQRGGERDHADDVAADPARRGARPRADHVVYSSDGLGGPTPATSAPRRGAPLPHPHRDRCGAVGCRRGSRALSRSNLRSSCAGVPRRSTS